MVICRPPCPALRPFVALVWADDAHAGLAAGAVRREHVLPTGHMHLALRLTGPGVRVWRDGESAQGIPLPAAVIGGARSAHYVRAPSPGAGLGAQLRPGAAAALFGAPADVFSGRHTALADVCPELPGQWMEALDAAPHAAARLVVFERLLWQRLQAAQAPHPAVRRAVAVIEAGGSIEQAVNQAHCSHRHLLTLFKQATGLAPKAYARLVRLQGVLRALHRQPALGWAEAADAAGYSDQSHFNREFRAFSGLTPAQWRRAGPAHPNHVPLPAAR